MNCSEFRDLNAAAYRKQNATLFGLIPTWGDLGQLALILAQTPGHNLPTSPDALFAKFFNTCLAKVDEQSQAQQIDWNNSYALKPLLESPHLADVVRETLHVIHRARESHGAACMARDILAGRIRARFREQGLGHLVMLPAFRGPSKAIDPSTLLATVLVAILGVLVPQTAPFAGLETAVLSAILRVFLSSLTASYKSGNFGASPAEFANQVHAWAVEAGAAA